jgi:hypothetical protein
MSVSPADAPVSLVALTKDMILEGSGPFAVAPPTVETAHEACVEGLTSLVNRLRTCEDIGKSDAKRVRVVGVLLPEHAPGVKFSVEFREKALYRVRVQTLNEDVDKTALPEAAGGAGLMASATAADPIETTAAPRKRARKAAAASAAPTETLGEVLQRAMDIAFMSGNGDVVAKLEPLLKLCEAE